MQVVYAVMERNEDDPDSRDTLAKLFTNSEAAERWAAIMQDESDTLVMYGKENIQYTYSVWPWEVHNE